MANDDLLYQKSTRFPNFVSSTNQKNKWSFMALQPLQP